TRPLPLSFILPSLFSNFTFFSTDSATPAISTLSLHDALPISLWSSEGTAAGSIHIISQTWPSGSARLRLYMKPRSWTGLMSAVRSEEHTSELQSRENLVCRLLLEKKNKVKTRIK